MKKLLVVALLIALVLSVLTFTGCPPRPLYDGMTGKPLTGGPQPTPDSAAVNSPSEPEGSKYTIFVGAGDATGIYATDSYEHSATWIGEISFVPKEIIGMGYITEYTGKPKTVTASNYVIVEN